MTEPGDHDDREGIEPEALDEAAGDPVAAFDALRLTVEDFAGDLTREMTTIRKGVEAAFEEFDRYGPPADYKPELAQIVQQLAYVGERVQGVEQSPILRQGAQHYAAALERGGESLVRTAAQQFERQASDLERAGRVLSLYVASARERHVQNRRLWIVGGTGLVLGILLTLFAPRVLPGSIDMAVASTAMNADRWNAGVSLMRSGHPRDWNTLISANDLVRDNRPALTVCAELAATAKKDQPCTIIVAPLATPAQ
ncbi:hypothetical protein GGQ99_005178 [Aminobacter niigataensis]|uniref:Uncharacterized protein n=1 Tax=Aminobacter niigataensis TaxID=83265 RepID=A0ABR6L9A4_9HYPH|nr:DUF6118 family protein [Aminobacter niigataensis]MBB4653387.1 hypothetical protein [Aminobacter niigataensis]